MSLFTSMFAFADFGSALVNVLAIIAIIIAGGFIVVFLGNLLLSILDPKTESKNQKKENSPQVIKEEQKYVEPIQIREEQKETYKSVDEDLAEKERLELGYAESYEEKPVVEERPIVKEEAKDGFEDLRLAEEEFRRQNLRAVEEKKSMLKAEESVDLNDIFFDGDFNFGELLDEPAEETKEELGLLEEPVPEQLEITEPVEESQEVEQIEEESQLEGQVSIFSDDLTVAEDTAEEVPQEELVSKTEIESAQAEIEELKKELESQKAEYEALRKQSEEEKNKWMEERENLQNLFEAEKLDEISNVMTLSEYQERLVVLKERLKVNEKDLKANKKEFLPLMRVRKNLDNDKKKLRRREALVAKQKVVLYGVNNYVDIDEEKAKKLAEDLDLLDGLRVSVQHCEEVITANKERYPILETTYRILTTTNKELKQDIADVEKAIKKLKEEQDAQKEEVVVEEVRVSEEIVVEEQPAVEETEKNDTVAEVIKTDLTAETLVENTEVEETDTNSEN